MIGCPIFFQHTERHNHNLVLLHITLHQFKRVHSTLGPQVSDHVIIQIARRIQASVRESDRMGCGIHEDQDVASLFRVSGDEFLILCPNIPHPENAIKIASRIIDIMKLPFNADETAVNIAPRIGMTTDPTDATDGTTLVQCAVRASAQVTASEQGGFGFYSGELNARSCERLQLETDLRHAILAGNQLVLDYQPKVSVRSGQITGVEGLIRRKKPVSQFIFPDSFLPLAH